MNTAYHCSFALLAYTVVGVRAVSTGYRTAIAFSIETCRYLPKPKVSKDNFGIPEFCHYIGRKPTLCRLLPCPEAMLNKRAVIDTSAQKKFKIFIPNQGSSTFQINNRIKDCFSLSFAFCQFRL